jgi:hypothetical protein
MSDPAGVDHQQCRAAIDDATAYLFAMVQRRRERQARPPDLSAESTDTAGHCRPLGAGDQPGHDNDRASRPRDCAAVAEDSHHDGLTTTAGRL